MTVFVMLLPPRPWLLLLSAAGIPYAGSVIFISRIIKYYELSLVQCQDVRDHELTSPGVLISVSL